MPTDSEGNYSLPDGSIVTTGTTATAASQNTPNEDIAAALTARLMANGAKTWTGNQNAGGYKVTNLAAATTNGDAVRYEQWQLAAGETNRGIIELATTTEAATGTDTARAVTPAGLPAYANGRAASTANIWAGTADKVVETDVQVAAGAYVSLSFNATLTMDCEDGLRRSCTVTDDFTLNLTDGKPGFTYAIKLIQGTGAPHAMTAGANLVFTADLPQPDLSTVQGDEDVLFFYCDTASKFVFSGSLIGI